MFVRAVLEEGVNEQAILVPQRGVTRNPAGQAMAMVVGAEDTLTPPPEAERMAAGIKGARLVKIPGAGHMPNVEQPALFDAALLEFIGGLPK